MTKWELTSNVLVGIEAKYHPDSGKSGVVSLEHRVNITPIEDDNNNVIIETDTTVVGEVPGNREAFRISCRYRANFKAVEGNDVAESPTEHTDYFGQQMFLIARTFLLLLFSQIGINATFLPYTLPQSDPEEEKI